MRQSLKIRKEEEEEARCSRQQDNECGVDPPDRGEFPNAVPDWTIHVADALHWRADKNGRN